MTKTLALNFNYAYGEPITTAIFRLQNSDFIVREDLGLTPSGDGEHLLLHIKKIGENTSWVAEKLAAHFCVKVMDVSYCGKKDRNAETFQWFSIYLPGTEGKDTKTDWATLPQQCGFEGEILEAVRHMRKLRRGAHKSNHFQIRLRDVSDIDEILARIEKIQRGGVPNYFGEQRFGRDGSNLEFASRWFETGEKIKNRGKRSMVMSAARSYLFNQVLSSRVDQDNWRVPVSGDPSTEHECASGPLWGRGRLKSSELTLEIEAKVLHDYTLWCEHLEHLGLLQERRPLRLDIAELSWQIEERDVLIAFALPPGQYATALLRELCQLRQGKISES